MYHCHIQFYLSACPPGVTETVKAMAPLPRFTHGFEESGRAQPAPAARADVILACLDGTEEKTELETLLAAKGKKTQLILLARPDQLQALAGCLPQVTDVWTLPMPEEVLRFRLLRWQEGFRTGRELWQTGHYLDAVIDNSPNLIWFKDKNGLHIKVNDSFCKTVNKTKQQVQGRRHAYIWDVEEDDPACIESERIVMESEQTCVSQETIQTGEGLRMLTTYKSPLYDLDGSVMGTVGVAIDVTQEHAYRQELIQKSRTLEAIFTTMDCGVICHTVDGSRLLSINRAALKILGYASQEELESDGFAMVAGSVLEEDRTALEESIRSLTNVGDSISAEYRVRHSGGEILHVMGNVKLVEEDGQLFYQRFLLDCTAQKLQEERERRTREQRQLELIQALGIDYSLICVFDLDSGQGSALRISDCPIDLLEGIFSGPLNLETCMEQYIQACVYSEDRDSLRRASAPAHLREVLAKDRISYLNYRTLCQGQMRYFQMKAVLAGGQETNSAVVLGFRSVDEETRREMEKKSLLENALSQANRASKAKSVFLSNMSHDIRTPMNAIVGFTALAITHIDRKEQVEEYLKKIMASGNHLLSLINDILDMSRIESGKMSLEENLCSLPDILHGLRTIIQADVHAKQLELYMDAVDVLDENIYCDKLRLNQVLLNLLSNAVKYTGAGGTVSVRVMEKPGAPTGYGNYEFHIKDTGIGMSQEFVSHIFEPFEREQNSTISGIQGTGLGMAITKNIVDMMNGSIELKSEQGVGSEFTLRLTFRLHSGPKEPQTIPALKNCRALVVDDDFNTCDSVTYMLQQMGLRAEWTLSGKEAVLRTRQAVMREDYYCVYIIDWLLPDMNGVEVARRVRKEMGEEVPIIVLTAYDWSEIEEEARDAGVTAFCSKPLFFSELRRCLRSVADPEIKGRSDEEKPRQIHTGRILLAEDNALNQEIATELLTEAGFTVEVADNGAQAVDMLQKSQAGYYNLVLMDVQMPVMDGYTAARTIRALPDPELSGIPILAMTANAFEEDKREALRNGMNGHLAKPIDIKVLFDTLDKVLSQAAQ